MNTWFIIAQIFGVITICFEFASYQIKDKRKYLLVNGIGSAFWAVMFVFIGLSTPNGMATQLSLVIVAVYSSIRALVFWWIFAKDSPTRRKAGRIFLLVMVVIAVSAGIVVIINLPTPGTQALQSIALIFALGFVIGQYLPGKHPVRISVFFYAIMLFLTQTPLNILEGNGIERWNIMGMLIELAKISSVIMFYALLVSKKRLVKKLAVVKATVNCELSKIKSDSEISVIADSGIMKLSDLEKLVAKMIRMEIRAIDTSEITNVGTTEERTQAIMDDLRTVHDLKMIMERVIRLKRDKLKGEPKWVK
ncbi:MAG: YgjV family protein [Firmicutes bacterium]|nr:YgjV family protein [Bacillota bacterium]